MCRQKIILTRPEPLKLSISNKDSNSRPHLSSSDTATALDEVRSEIRESEWHHRLVAAAKKNKCVP